MNAPFVHLGCWAGACLDVPAARSSRPIARTCRSFRPGSAPQLPGCSRGRRYGLMISVWGRAAVSWAVGRPELVIMRSRAGRKADGWPVRPDLLRTCPSFNSRVDARGLPFSVWFRAWACEGAARPGLSRERAIRSPGLLGACPAWTYQRSVRPDLPHGRAARSGLGRLLGSSAAHDQRLGAGGRVISGCAARSGDHGIVGREVGGWAVRPILAAECAARSTSCRAAGREPARNRRPAPSGRGCLRRDFDTERSVTSRYRARVKS